MMERMLAFYNSHARDLPWRKNPTPYRVWVSEIMLQQTRVEAVREYYERFMKVFPTVELLAAAPEETLFKLWEGLGYYSRARNLQKAAKEIVAAGKFPSTRETIAELPGVGPYTAGAIASIAFGQPEPAVDGNVLRVFARWKGHDFERAELEKLLRPLYPAGHCSEFTQSLMELGATVCVPNGTPLCPACPLRTDCVARWENRIAELPAKPVKKPRKIERLTILVIQAGNRIAIRKRTKKGLLAGLWEFPNFSGGAADEASVRTFLEPAGFQIRTISPFPASKHIFSHVEWHMSNFWVEVEKPAREFQWVTPAELEEKYAVASAFAAQKNRVSALSRKIESEADGYPCGNENDF